MSKLKDAQEEAAHNPSEGVVFSKSGLTLSTTQVVQDQHLDMLLTNSFQRACEAVNKDETVLRNLLLDWPAVACKVTIEFTESPLGQPVDTPKIVMATKAKMDGFASSLPLLPVASD